MQIIVHNTLPILYDAFTKRFKAEELLPRFLEWAESEQGFISLVRNAKGRHGFQDFDMLSAVRSDGIDILEAQQQYGLFNPTRSLEATEWSFDESERRQLADRIAKTLEILAKAVPSRLLPDRLVVAIVPADCANGTLMMNGSGISCYGRAPGYLFVRIWPSAGNLRRLGYILARSFIHGIRRTARNEDSAISLGEAVVMEGLAAAFIHTVFSDAEFPALIHFMPPDDWGETLAELAGYYGKTSYDDVPINIYGTRIQAGSFRSPDVVPLTREELQYACELIIAHSERTEANIVAAYLYGDPLLAAQGHPTFGIPHLAGFEAGYHTVQRYLETTGIEIASALSLPWRDILEMERK
ncbi:DUF2268 domain-containing putative Zn-dependent protease [Paenibacillus sp. GYB003]|uniref:DUF2268 domain-containing putative Zn-dependent protease n=1 Tax=Paenibacillus sp. GYB003 TaxID=2994392 RepID=UPI002F965966